jgi:hypothetical protein
METVYIVVPLLLIGVVLAAVWLDRWSVPVILVALGLGILFGSDVLNVWHFEDVELTNQVANLALVFILFQGGFATKREDLQAVALPALGLATWGVLLTAAFTFVCLHFLLGWSTEKSLLLAVIISSTDAAATFSILRRQALPSRLGSTIEIESAANDPMAILTTLIVVEAYSHRIQPRVADRAAVPVEVPRRPGARLADRPRRGRGVQPPQPAGARLLLRAARRRRDAQLRAHRAHPGQRHAGGLHRRPGDGQHALHLPAGRQQLRRGAGDDRQHRRVRADGRAGVPEPVGGPVAARGPAVRGPDSRGPAGRRVARHARHAHRLA